MSCNIYLISPPALDVVHFTPLLDEALATKKVSVFQLRLKHSSDDAIIKTARTLLPVCHRYGVPFILNDRPDLVVQTGADGVHIGEEDGACETARNILGKQAMLGVSCYDSIDRAMQAGEQGADYVSFGAFYPTATKTPKAHPSVDILTKWVGMSDVPCTAIGGITDKNCKPLVAAGADFISVVSFVWGHPAGSGAAISSLFDGINNFRTGGDSTYDR